MPPIDPERLLRTLSPLLDTQSGAIKSANEVDKLYGLMSKFSKKLVSKIIYINILKSTPTDVLDLFMQRGGWEMICNWATEGMNYKNWPFLKVVTELLMLTPATVARLKDNGLPKIIKSVAKECENEEMRAVASQVYDKWMGIAQHRETPLGFVAPQLHAIAIHNHLSDFEIQNAVVIPGEVVENQVILEADPTSGAFDLTQYIDAADLNTLETDFNPDDFNSTVEEHLMDGTEMVDGEALVQHQDMIQNQQGTDMLHQISPIKLQSTDPNDKQQSLRVVTRDGKRLVLRMATPVRKNDLETAPLVPSNANDSAVGVPEKKPKSPGKPRMPSSGKPKMPSSGKPPLKAYEAKTKKANTAESSKLSKGIPNFYAKDSKNKVQEEDKDEKDKEKEKERKQRSKEKESEKKKQHSVMSAARAAIEAKRRIEEEKQEKLRLKVKEQKRVRDQRKEEMAKKQKEIDDETLKALKLTAQPPTKIPKIPKKTTSFADMIAIPGASNSKEKEAKKITTSAVSKPSKETEKEKAESKITSEKDVKSEDVTSGSRRSRPKVYVSGKSRSLGLLEEMEQSQNKGKVKAEPKVEEVDKDKEASVAEKKVTKRPSLDTVESPAKKVKKEPVAKKVVGIQESSLFMDALNHASTTTRTTRSSKRRASTSESAKETPTTPPVTTPLKSPVAEDVKPVVFNFYRDTLVDNDENNPSQESEEKKEPTGSEDREDDDINIPIDAFVPAEGEGLLKSALVIHRPKNKPKKSVRWVEDSELKRFHYFDMDETERVNVTRIPRNFTEMKQIERSEERKALRRSLQKDNMEEKIPWTTPRKIEFITEQLGRGEFSTEKVVQAERERLILEVVYFTKSQIPDSPTEPTEGMIKNQDDPATLKMIPYEDIPGVTVQENYVFKSPNGADSKMNVGRPNSFGQPLVQTPPPGFNANYLPNQNQQQMPPTDVAAQMQAQAQYNNLWNTLSQVPNAAAAVAAAGLAAAALPGTDMYNQFQVAQGLAAAALGTRGMPNFPLNMPFSFPPPSTGAAGYGTNLPGLLQNPPPANHVPPPDQFGGQMNANSRFNGPPPTNNRGGMGARDNRSGRPNRWDDRGNYDERRRDGDRNARNNDRDRDRGRGGAPRGDRGGGRDREFHRTERNRAGTPRTVLCKFFQQGCCKVGEDCDFLHPGINGPTRPSRFSNRFPSPPPSSTQPRSAGRLESPVKTEGDTRTPDDDNWDAPETNNVASDAGTRNSTTSFDQPPSSPTDDPLTTPHPPRMIPLDESQST